MEDGDYHQFLRSLDDSQLIDHISRISQEKYDPPIKTSTPKSPIASTQSSDPFDDGLDSVLVNVSLSTRKLEDLIEKSEDASEEEGERSQAHNHSDNRLSQYSQPPVKQQRQLDQLDQEDEDKEKFADDAEVSDDAKFANDSELSEDQQVVGELHGFGDYETYFHNKHMKQQVADDLYVQWENQRIQNSYTPIFTGCVVYVNGHTEPSINEIHRLVVLHGGKFLSYLSNKSSATHIICDRLTPRKNIEFRNFKVVKAKWLTDSIAQNTLLPWRDYRTISDVEYGQKRLQFLSNQNSHQIPVNDDLANELDNELNSGSESVFDTIDQNTSDHEINDQTEKSKFMSENQASKQEYDSSKVIDAKHPDFLKHFFARSRLHHLSTWKADLRLKVLKMVLNSNKLAKKSCMGKNRLILHIDFDCFFASVSCLNCPNLDINKDPLVVTHGGKSADIASCNYVARKFGVRNGMWLGTAEKLCPQMIKLDYDFDAYEKQSNAFYSFLLEYPGLDSVFPVLIDEVLIDASSILNSADDKLKCVEDLCSNFRKNILKLTKCTVSIGASHNVLLAKLATKRIKPDGQFYLYEDVNLFLKKVLVRDLPGIGRSIESKIQETLGELEDSPKIEDILQFSKSRLEAQFGQKTGEKLFNYSRGIDDTSVSLDLNNPESVLGRKSVSVDVNFGIRFDTMDQLDFFLMQMAKELYTRLVNLGLCGSTLNMRLAKRAPGAPVVPPKHLGMGLCEFVNKTSRLGVATSDWGIIGSELKSMYRMINIPVNELRGIAITMTKLIDVDAQSKAKQTTLRFNNIKKRKAPNLDGFQQNKVENSQFNMNNLEELNNIDWSVFDLLPLSIKYEIKKELFRRGIVDKRQKKPGVKTSLQYLLPTQPGSTPKFIRVVESPKKQKTKPNKVKSKSPLPTKSKNEDIYEQSASYNMSVIEELPSTIKEEVLKDMEYKKKIKEYDLESLRNKMNRRQGEKSVNVQEVTGKWIAKQNKYNPLPRFSGKLMDLAQIKNCLDQWIVSSLQQQGPHEDDLQFFVQYLHELNQEQKTNICSLLVKHIKKCLQYQRAITYSNPDNLPFIEKGLDVWDSYLRNEVAGSLRNLDSQ
jgi:DNA repair protein REV1